VSRVGQRWNIPASVPGTPAYLRKKIADGMAIVAKLGDPTLFVTVTMDANCDEVKSILSLLGCPDDDPLMHSIITTRVFRAKLQELERCLREGVLLGRKAVYIQRCREWQKRGLVHAHLLIRLEGAQPVTANEIDALVSARLFHSERCTQAMDANCECTAHTLYRIVRRFNLHDCRRGRCLKAGAVIGDVCSKSFPKPVMESSTLGPDGRWSYRRGNDDRYVVAYNPVLTLLLNCHVNVEVCTGPAAASYLRKYTAKMPDACRYRLETSSENTLRAELIEWLRARYLSCGEAVTRLLQIDIQHMEPSVICLPVHLPDEQRVVVNLEDVEQQHAVADRSDTLLLRYFSRPEVCCLMLYMDYHEKYTLSAKESDLPDQHQHRKYLHERRVPIVSRLARVPLSTQSRETYCLRQLLLQVAAKCFGDLLKDHTGQVHGTFTDSAIARGLFHADKEIDLGMQYMINPHISSLHWERILAQDIPSTRECTAEELQHFWLIHILAGAPNNREIFDRYWPYMCRNMPRSLAQHDIETLRSLTLVNIAKLLKPHKLTTKEVGLDAVEGIAFDVRVSDQVKRILEQQLRTSPELNNSQQAFKDKIRAAMDGHHQQKLFYLSGDAGTGKSTVVNQIIAEEILRGKVVICAAFMGNTACRLVNGDTLHRWFALPLMRPGQEQTASSKLTPDTAKGRAMQEVDLIIIEEISMVHRRYFELVDEGLRNCCMTNELFGGKRVIVLGDLKQLTPIAADTNRQTCIDATVTSCPLWSSFATHTLQLQQRSQSDAFTAFVQSVGYGLKDGQRQDGRHIVECPQWLQRFNENQFEEAAAWIGENVIANPKAFADRQIIAYTHEVCKRYNDHFRTKVSTALAQPIQHLQAVNKPPESKSEVGFAMATPEYLAVVEVHGAPPHTLSLFPGAVVSVLRNLDVTIGLCNGTKAIVDAVSPFVIALTIVSDNPLFNGTKTKVPRILFDVDASSGISFQRLQFPLKLAYAVTVNRAQGATITDRILFDVSGGAFVHGQTYVALSRGRNPINLSIFGEAIVNVTYQAVITPGTAAVATPPPPVDTDDEVGEPLLYNLEDFDDNDDDEPHAVENHERRHPVRRNKRRRE